jgi:SAM-dependent methyltransferase
MSQYNCFLAPNALAINAARQEHLASLGLDLRERTVLEVGAGIGLHSAFFIESGCDITITDGRPENMAEIRRRHPGVKNRWLDLEVSSATDDLGEFDIIYCYGLLYHMSQPDVVLEKLASVCRDKILLELICSPSEENTVQYVADPPVFDQSTVGRGCRPSRRWILDKLTKYFGHGYISSTQPNHQEFPLDWSLPSQYNTRAIFVGSKTAINNPLLLTEPLQQQQRYDKGQ